MGGTNATKLGGWRPRLLGCYEVREALGEGGFGQVFAGWDTRLQRPVALKVLHAGNDAAGDDLLREARLAAVVRHPAMVAIHDVVTAPGLSVIVMERVFGRTLKASLAQQTPGLADVLAILRQTAAALASLHGHGLVHGDLKPSNLMLDNDGRVRVLDFGLARLVDATQSCDAEAGQVLGTPAFMAPERLQGAAPSPASDVYALGLIGQALLGGRTDETTQPVGALPVAERDTRLALAAVLARMTQPSPAQRLPSMAAALAEFERLATPVMPRPRPRLPLRVLALSIPLLLVIGAFGAGLWAMATTASPAGASADTQPHAPRESFAKAEALLANFDEEGAVADAIRLLEPIAAPGALHAPAAGLLAIAYCLRYAGDERDAIWLQRADTFAGIAVQADDQLALAQTARAWALEYRGDQAGAEIGYDTALALDPDNHYALVGRARLLVAQRRFDEADAAIDDALARHPLERQFWDWRGTLRFRQADYPAAEAAFRHSIKLKPDSVYAYANLGAALLRQDRSDDALAVLQQGLKVRPHGRLYSNLGTTLYARGRHAEAAAAFEAALSDTRGSPNDYLRWANFADALRWTPGREDDAPAAYTRALQLLETSLAGPDPDATRLSRAALYAARLGQSERARGYLAQVDAAGAKDADLHVRTVLTAEALGDRELALANLADAVRLGYPVRLLEAEPELTALRRDTRYHLTLTRNSP